ncbi:diguanylate cyclase domain-containing protein [Bariatricus sp. HCP28S3_A7]|uniref:sensor domain-containing diguanylate cyclase n=1 Tax=Bariatricus sp. HCP28S3_A7 TaxID=3438894 RepID=UPI003F8A7DB0
MKKWFRENKKYGYLLVFILAVLFLVGSLFDFSMLVMRHETNQGYENLRYTNEQHSLIVQNQIDQYFVALIKDALLLSKQELTDQETCLEFFERLMELPDMDFGVFGIADLEGNTFLSTGEKTQVKDRQFFKEAVNGRQYITEKKEELMAVIAVPIMDEDERVKGVLYGEIPLDDMELFNQILEEKQAKYLFLLDSDGNYIVRYGITLKEKSLIETLDMVRFDKDNPQVHNSTQVLEKMKKKEEILYAINRGQNEEIGVLTPIPDSSWYLCEVTNRETIIKDVRYYQRDMMLLTFKLLTMAVVLIGIYMYYTVKEKKKIKQLYTELSLNEELYRVIAEHSEQCIFTYDGTTKKIQFMNEKYREFGILQQDIDLNWILKELQKNNLSACHRVENLAASVYDYVPEMEVELLIQINGQKRFLKVCLINLFDQHKLVARSIGIIEDITEQKENEMMMRREQEFRKSLLADCLGYLEVDVGEDMITDNSFDLGTTEEMKGSFSTMIRFYVEKKVVPEHREKVLMQMSKQAIEANCKCGVCDMTLEYQTIEKDGKHYWTECEIRAKQSENKKKMTAYLVYRNIDEKKKEKMRLEIEAMTDVLTGALKRNAAVERMKKMEKSALPEERCHVFMILDMDNFKQLNDTLGHMCGDQALKDFVEKARQNCRHDDIICRLGGDEFIIIMNAVPRENVEKKVSELQKVFRTTYEKNGFEVVVTTSVGVALMPDHGNDFDKLYAVADKALYAVKTSTKDGYCIAG